MTDGPPMIGADGHLRPRLAADTTRRLAGSAVLIGVLLAIMLVGAVRDQVIPGRAVALPVKQAPQIGDCVTENPHSLGVDVFDLPALRIEPCSGLRFGEVAFVVDDFAPSTSDPGPDPCGGHVRDYLGTPGPPPEDGSFTPFAVIGWTLLGPDPRQRAAGQKWVACAVYFPAFGGTAAPVTVDHSLKGAWQRTEDGRLFALCLDDTASVWPAHCRAAHRFEVLGMAVGAPGIPQPRVESACRQLVVQALGSSTALDSGDLGTRVLPVRNEPDNRVWITGPDAISADSGYSNFCMATPTDRNKQLTAPLRGLGDGVVPLN